MKNYALMGLVCFSLVATATAGPLAGCYTVQGTWSELLQGGVNGAAGNVIQAGDGVSYSFEAILSQVQPDSTGEYDWVTVYTNGVLVLDNVDGVPWFNPYQTAGSTTEVALGDVLVKTRSTRYDGTPDQGKLEFVLSAQSGWYTISANYSGVPAVNPVDGTTDYIASGTLSGAEVCIEAGAFKICQESLNIKSRGVVPVVLFGTASFDVSKVDRSSIRLENTRAIRCNSSDVDGDGIADLVLKFQTQDLAPVLLETPDKTVVSLVLSATLSDGVTTFAGADDVRILNKGKPGKPVKTNHGKGAKK